MAEAGEVLEEIDGDLVLRRGSAADADALASFNVTVHNDERVGVWVRDQLTRPHPTMRPDDFTVVAQRASGRIVSSLNLIPQTWTYGGVPFGVGRPEVVGTLPEFRRRGLVRRQMATVHRWSAERGHLLQAITGIPWYYRQFGYEMALSLGGQRRVDASLVPPVLEGGEPYRFRDAGEGDLPLLQRLDVAARERSLVACVRDAAAWRYELDGKSELNSSRRVFQVIETPGGEAVGAMAYRLPQSPALSCRFFELLPGTTWVSALPSLLRHLVGLAPRLAHFATGGQVQSVSLSLGPTHPAYAFVPGGGPGRQDAIYAWYLRVPDLARFVRHVAPVLEARLARSDLTEYSGELRLDFFRGGLLLAFERGRLVTCTPWDGEQGALGATFPDLTVLQLLFGYRSLGELEHAFADCRARSLEARALLEVLFPVEPSHVWPMD